MVVVPVGTEKGMFGGRGGGEGAVFRLGGRRLVSQTSAVALSEILPGP